MDTKQTYLIGIDTGPQQRAYRIRAGSEAEAKKQVREALSRGEWPEGERVLNFASPRSLSRTSNLIESFG